MATNFTLNLTTYTANPAAADVAAKYKSTVKENNLLVLVDVIYACCRNDEES